MGGTPARPEPPGDRLRPATGGRRSCRRGTGRLAVRIAAPVLVAVAVLAAADPARAPEPAHHPDAAGAAAAGGTRLPTDAGTGADAGPVRSDAAPAGTGAIGEGPGPGRASTGAGLLPAGPVPLVRSEPVRLRVARLGLDTTPVPLGLHPDGAMQVPDDAGTVGWFTGAPTPGELGPAVLAAHVDWKGLPGAFAELDSLQSGDEIRVDRADGSSVVFAVTRVDQYPKAAFPTAEVYGDLDHAGLRLITCGGTFDRGADSYRDNVVVFAKQVR
ncbi:class F sortase [Pseudonocardia sp. C8]|uniref:class F sortase n=1 Tax=Pseudonocardia sp. C8 TaxID=2762759 RepID=UPI00351BFA05